MVVKLLNLQALLNFRKSFQISLLPVLIDQNEAIWLRLAPTSNPHNHPVDFVEVGIWSWLELDVGIICACLPNFHSLLKPVYAWLSSRTRHSRSGNSGSAGKYRRRLDDVEQSGPENIIQATTVVVVNDYRTKGSFINPIGGGLGENGAAGNTVQGIELGTSVKGMTSGRAWS